jgi:hypothetical protein
VRVREGLLGRGPFGKLRAGSSTPQSDSLRESRNYAQDDKLRGGQIARWTELVAISADGVEHFSALDASASSPIIY